ncbi:uncharacterized protein LOC119188589 [Manduca sexta]|uniref:uncharacterized protein LOC119188589 n=1 Tax=Manduca sexta TaxID=7130 RepID=UPI00188F6F59|nr:uncharacterized protein LOC119188589 [Manduca sexta]
MEYTTRRIAKTKKIQIKIIATSNPRSPAISMLRARRLAQARAELTALKIELAAAKLAEIEAEDSEDDLESVITEAGQDCRVHSWVQTSQLLAIESRPTDVATGKQAPIQSSDPVIAAVSWDNPATVPAGASAVHPPTHPVTTPETNNPSVFMPFSVNPTAQPEVPTIEAASWQRTQQATQPLPVIAARSDEHRATKQPPPVVAAWLRDNSASQQPQSTPNPQQVQDGALVASRPRTEYQELASAITQAVQAAQHRQPLRCPFSFALLDDGSTVSLIDDELARDIGAEGPDEPLHIATYDGERKTRNNSRRVKFNIEGSRGRLRIEARTVDNLQLAAQRIPDEAIRDCGHLKGLLSAKRAEEAKPRILIGQDNWHLLLATKTRSGRRHQPVASLTPLGWVIHGSRTRTLGHRVNFVGQTTTDERTEELLRNFITSDNLFIEPRRPKNDPGEKALKILNEHTERSPEGRYQTALLWKSDSVELPNNYENTLKRLHNIENKLDKNPDLKERYEEQMEALVKKGYAEIAPRTSHATRTWYLPHFAVVNALKPDKLRVVHDAAAKTKGTTLNENLLTGPDLLQPLPAVLLRFREHPVAVTADITEMFMQVGLREEDRDALRYLWRGNRRDSRPPEVDTDTRILEAVEAIKKKHYMDDYLDSYEDEHRVITIATQVRNIHREAHFELRKWTSNSPAVLKALGESPNTTEAVEIERTERVLGLIWRPQEDRLAFNLDLARIPSNLLRREAPTKREALKIVMSLFDPLGLVSPITVRAKQLLQEVWRRGTDWDDPIDDELSAAWVNWLTHLKQLSGVTVPRCYPGYSRARKLQLHVFTDASESAYATALYWRAEDDDGRVTVTLLAAKAKVAPLKLTSIPRLELQAAVLGARMAASVTQEHSRQPESTTYWTDSKTTLCWIRTGARSYKPYVAHRIAAIEEYSQANQWRWVPTRYNVADDATRDVPDNFTREHRWFNGPEFLRDPPELWPAEETQLSTDTGEERVNTVTERREKHRISAATGVSAATKNPPIVDGEHRATKLWVEHVHTQLHHAGVESVVNYCRQHKWVIRLRPTVKAVVRSCFKCRQRAATPPQPITGDLPPCRLAHHHRPFTYTGLDYFGPLTVTVGRSNQKRYVALFTCLTVRAVHLEVVHSLSTQGAIMALRRMTARRGSPAEIWSDNGTNFHGAEKELRNTLLAGAEQEASRRTALTTVLHEQRPHEETLSTLLAEVEFTVNSRPLTHVSVNPEDPEALTPNHFLLGCQGPLAAPNFPAEHGYGTHADLRASQQLADAFWTRWLREYLPELRNRREPRSKGPELHIGDIVRIVDGTLPRNTWVRGRICATHPGPDGVTRTVDVATQGGVLRRPVKKIVLLHPAAPELRGGGNEEAAPQSAASTSCTST